MRFINQINQNLPKIVGIKGETDEKIDIFGNLRHQTQELTIAL